MTEKSKAQTGKVGSAVKATEVVRPDGSVVAVSGGLYVLDVPGVHVVDGVEVTAR